MEATTLQKYSITIEKVYIANLPDTFVSQPLNSIHLVYGGIAGDLHFGLTKPAGTREKMYPRGTEIFNRRQITVVSMEECQVIAERLGVDQLLPEWFGANIAISGFPNFTKLPAGSRILFPSGAGLLCEGENHPCASLASVIQENIPDQSIQRELVQKAMGLRGIIAMVEREGVVHEGDNAEIWVMN